MLEFFTEKRVKRASKEYRCDACHMPIKRGESYVYMTMKYEGEFETCSQHPECREAEVALADLHGLSGGHDWIFLHDLDPEDREWVEANHPAAFARIQPRKAPK